METSHNLSLKNPSLHCFITFWVIIFPYNIPLIITTNSKYSEKNHHLINYDILYLHSIELSLLCRINLFCDCGLTLAGCSGFQQKWMKALQVELKTRDPHFYQKKKKEKLATIHAYPMVDDVFQTRKMILTAMFQCICGGWENGKGKKEGRVSSDLDKVTGLQQFIFFLKYSQVKK